jgi:enoyl-CoA hydratase
VVRFEVKGRVAIVTLDRPEKKNAVDVEMAHAISDALTRVEEDEGIWAGVLAAEGDVYCAGADLSIIASGRAEELILPEGGWAGFVARARTKPFIAAIEGIAVAGGFELALACDLIVASSATRFALPEVKRGLFAAAGGAFRLPRVLPKGLALEMLMTGNDLEASRAHDLGVVSLVTEPGGALAGAMALAEQICSNSPLAVRAVRELALAAYADADAAGWERTASTIIALQETEDFKEGPRAFLERRAPVWRGR